jgi:hypothetical protein
MVGLANLPLGYIWNSFQSREHLRAEIVVLRHQLNILQRRAPKRPRLSGSDRALFVWLYRLCPEIVDEDDIFRFDLRRRAEPVSDETHEKNNQRPHLL